MTKFRILALISLVLIKISIAKSQKPFEILSDFDKNNIPEAPNYGIIKNWAAHPEKIDKADEIPINASGIKNDQANAKADVFFIHPTIYTKKPTNGYTWNASSDDEELNSKVDESTILNQATIFNGSCRVFAPRFRQAHYSAFTTNNKTAAKNSLDLAYEDIKNSFNYYLEKHNAGRPIIIAGHSQGTVHAKRLLKEYFDGKPLQKQLVEAYLVGIATSPTEFVNIKPSLKAEEFGGFVSWNTFANEYYPPYYNGLLENAFVVNPMTWSTSEEWVTKESNTGGVGLKFKFVNNAVDARVHKGLLWINKPYVKGRIFLKQKVWHAADYNLFWMNTRENVALRINQYLKLNP